MADDITLPGTGTVVETQQQPDGSQRQVISVADIPVDTNMMLEVLQSLASTVDPVTGRMRVLIDPIGGAQTLGTITTVSTITTVTTVATVTNLAQVGGILATSQIQDAMQASWALSVRPRIT